MNASGTLQAASTRELPDANTVSVSGVTARNLLQAIDAYRKLFSVLQVLTKQPDAKCFVTIGEDTKSYSGPSDVQEVRDLVAQALQGEVLAVGLDIQSASYGSPPNFGSIPKPRPKQAW